MCIDEFRKQNIESFLKSNSNIASNRLVQLKDKNIVDFIPVRYLQDTKNEVYNKFPYKDGVSKTTFMKYLNKDNQYKNAFRKTDLCDYCEWFDKKKLQIKAQLKKIENFEYSDIFDPKELLKSFVLKKQEMLSVENPETEAINEIEHLIINLERCEIIMGHREIARIQRDSYNFQRRNKELLKSNILIEVLSFIFIFFIRLMCFINIKFKMDYKQKISIGLSPNQINKYKN